MRGLGAFSAGVASCFSRGGLLHCAGPSLAVVGSCTARLKLWLCALKGKSATDLDDRPMHCTTGMQQAHAMRNRNVTHACISWAYAMDSGAARRRHALAAPVWRGARGLQGMQEGARGPCGMQGVAHVPCSISVRGPCGIQEGARGPCGMQEGVRGPCGIQEGARGLQGMRKGGRRSPKNACDQQGGRLEYV